MLTRVFPVGTVLRDVLIEVSGTVSFGRQMGTYPILCGIPMQVPVGTVMDVTVVSYGQRSVTALPVPIEINRLSASALKWLPGVSVTALPVPIEINRLSASALKWLPGVSKKAAAQIAAKRPYADAVAFRSVISSEAVTPLIDLMRF